MPTHRVVRWDPSAPVPSETEAEAKLHQEGYEAFSWHDVPGTAYPKHRHEADECLWILKGQIRFTIQGEEIELKPGDRLYLPGGVYHTASVPQHGSVTYLVGRKTR